MDFYNCDLPDSVLSSIFYGGQTENDFRKAADEADWLHALGKLHIRHVERRQYCVEYLESDEYPIEREVYSRIVEVVKPYPGNILDDYKPFEIVFEKDKVEVCLIFDDDYQDKYDKVHDEYPFCQEIGSYSEIDKLIKERIESSFQTL